MDYLTKPVHGKELKARIDSLLKLKAYNDFLSGYQQELSSELTGKTKELKRSLEAFSRFVPKEFLKLLGKKDVAEVKAGDHSLEKLSILF